jgi:hypothetical protein
MCLPYEWQNSTYTSRSQIRHGASSRGNAYASPLPRKAHRVRGPVGDKPILDYVGGSDFVCEEAFESAFMVSLPRIVECSSGNLACDAHFIDRKPSPSLRMPQRFSLTMSPSCFMLAHSGVSSYECARRGVNMFHLGLDRHQSGRDRSLPLDVVMLCGGSLY